MQDEDQRAGVQFWLLPHAQQAMTDQFCRISTQLFCLKIAHLQLEAEFLILDAPNSTEISGSNNVD